MHGGRGRETASLEWKNTSLAGETGRWTKQTVFCPSWLMVPVCRETHRGGWVPGRRPPQAGAGWPGLWRVLSHRTGRGEPPEHDCSWEEARGAELLKAWARSIFPKQHPPSTCLAPRLQPWFRHDQLSHLGKRLSSPGSGALSLNRGHQALRLGLWCR